MNYSQERCVLCRGTFSNNNLPLLLPCTHYICSLCLNKHHQTHTHLICPEDLQDNPLQSIRKNTDARRFIQKLKQQQSNFNQNNQLLSIQALSRHFEEGIHNNREDQRQFEQLVAKVINREITRLRGIQSSIKKEMHEPSRKVKEWKQMVAQYLSELKYKGKNVSKEEISSQLGYFIEEGRRIKIQLSKYQDINYAQISNIVASNPTVCLRNEFSLMKYAEIEHNNKKPKNNIKTEEHHKQSNKSKKKINSENSRRNDTFNEQKQNCFEIRINNQSKQWEQSHIVEQPSKFSKAQQKSNKYSHIEKNMTKQNNQDRKHLSQCPKHYNTPFDSNLIYSSSPSHHQIIELGSDQLLLTENQPKKTRNDKFNFLVEWEITQMMSGDSVEVERREPLSIQKEKNSYIRKMQLLRVEQAIGESRCGNGTLQLINFNVQEIDIWSYLNHWDSSSFQVIKMVKTCLSDHQLNDILNYSLSAGVTTLVLSHNNLTQLSIDALLNFMKMNNRLVSVYLSKNQINTLRGHTRAKICLLRQSGLTLYI